MSAFAWRSCDCDDDVPCDDCYRQRLWDAVEIERLDRTRGAARMAANEARWAEMAKAERRANRPEFGDLVAALLWFAMLAGCAWLLLWQIGLWDLITAFWRQR